MPEWVSWIADGVGILSAIFAAVSWFKARKYAEKANNDLKIIQNYRKIEKYVEINKKLEEIRLTLREVGTSRSPHVQRRYKELETSIAEILHVLPSKETVLISNMQLLEEKIRIHGDQNLKLVNESQYQALEYIDVVKNGIKSLVEELKQEE